MGGLPHLPKECRTQEISPLNQSRAGNPFYNLEIGPSVMPPQMMQAAADNFQLPIGRNYMMSNAELQAELTRVFRAGGSAGINLPMQSPLNNSYSVGAGAGGGGGCFTVSGLNLNLGGATSQPVMRPMPPPAMNQHDATPSMMASAGSFAVEQGGYGAEMNGANGHSNRFMGMQQCMDLENYWPPY
ncbi:hypothetical protein OIU76_027663 [Salix suchowensis]|nr:hypothetical protein OIU76_027663 [Salix suchowensis]